MASTWLLHLPKAKETLLTLSQLSPTKPKPSLKPGPYSQPEPIPMQSSRDPPHSALT